MAKPELGFDVPALIGMREGEVLTPALLVDLDALERNILRMADWARASGMRLRPHGKMHKSVDVAKLQIAAGAVGICCQKVSEAEAFVRGGIQDILISNQVISQTMIDRMLTLVKAGAKISVCVDDLANVSDLSISASTHRCELDVMVEVDIGQGRCGVSDPGRAVSLAEAISAAPNLRLAGVQAYQGAMQHIETFEDRKREFARAETALQSMLKALEASGHVPTVVSGGGTGSFEFESSSSLWTELQCGSYAFMDADYSKVQRSDGGQWENALFLLTGIVSAAKRGQAVGDAGLKSAAVDSGLPTSADPDLELVDVSDEHCTFKDPKRKLAPGDKVRLVPGHCDPTVNLHDWLVGIRDGEVESLWPVSARGKVF